MEIVEDAGGARPDIVRSRGLVRQVIRGQRSDVFRVRESSLELHLELLVTRWPQAIATAQNFGAVSKHGASAAPCALSGNGQHAGGAPRSPGRWWLCKQAGWRYRHHRPEAEPLSQGLHRGLTDAGLDVVLMETRQVKGALKPMPIETDRRGAEGIARRFIWAGSGPYIASPFRHRSVRAFLAAARQFGRA